MDLLQEFEELKKLKDDPEAFAEKQHEIIRGFIDSIENPERRKHMEQFQWRIDGVMRKYKNPIARSNKIFAMMMESFNKLNDNWQEVNKLTKNFKL